MRYSTITGQHEKNHTQVFKNQSNDKTEVKLKTLAVSYPLFIRMPCQSYIIQKSVG